MSLRWILLTALTAFAGCGVPTVPDFTYFRLPPARSLEQAATALFRNPLVVDAFGADGLYGDQSLIYALDPGAQQLRQYHYQLWTDPPTRILQRRLIVQLREAHASAEVTDELPASQSAIRVRGIILRFDRVPTAAGGYNAVVALKLRADRPDGTPLLDDYYHVEVAAGAPDLKATVDAYGAALDTIFAQFYGDLRKRGTNANAQ